MPDILKKFTLAGILFTFLLGTLSHFVYGWTGDFFPVGFICPVNETVWEHEKLLFFPALLFILAEKRCFSYRFPELYIKNLAGLYLGMLVMPLLFYGYTTFTARNYLFIDIMIFVVSVLVTFLAAPIMQNLHLPKTVSFAVPKLLPILLLIFLVVSLFFMLFQT